jgi:UDP-2,4-diacetamido-2,4,6-trideoxy-beta-L-altropyranose hydrolase
MRVALCADGGSAGLGHLGRCAALGQALKELGHSVVFADVPRKNRAWLAALGFRSVPLGARYDVIVGDSYRFSPSKLRRLRARSAVLMLMDDDGSVKAPCDIVFNGNLGAEKLRFSAPASAKRLLGPKYALMRSAYWRPAKKKRIAPSIRRLLVTMGGLKDADDLMHVNNVVHEVQSAQPGTRVTALMGDFPSLPYPRPGVRFLRGVRPLRPLFEAHDAAVVAGGQTIYEAAFTGTPMLIWMKSRNQAPQSAAMIRAGAAADGSWRNLARALRSLTPARRAKMSRAGMKLVDGQGARRVAAFLTGGRA